MRAGVGTSGFEGLVGSPYVRPNVGIPDCCDMPDKVSEVSLKRNC